MRFTKDELCNMRFDDAYKAEKSCDNNEYCEYDEDCCRFCGNKLENLKIKFNEKEQLYKYECANCAAVYVIHENSEGSETVILQGSERNWPEYLTETLKFPFDAVITESNDREFFDPDYDGPCLYDIVRVLEVFKSMKYGVEALIRKGSRTYVQILSFMEAVDGGSHNYDELENYKRWREKYWLSDFVVALTSATKPDPEKTV